MQSILEILVINTKVRQVKKTGQDYSIPEAQCVLRNDDNTVAAVGVLVIPKHLEEVAKPGLYTGTFALEAAAYGENQGRIVAKLTGLTARARRRSAQATGFAGLVMLWLYRKLRRLGLKRDEAVNVARELPPAVVRVGHVVSAQHTPRAAQDDARLHRRAWWHAA